MEKYKEFIHFGLTSQDINNTAAPLSLKEALNDVYFPELESVISILKKDAEEWADIPMDVLFPKIGEIIGGSEREADYDKLLNRINELKIPMKDMWWYLDTRRFGTVPHSGFGLGFERLLLFVTGMTNIRDVIPFPRTPKNADF